MAIKLNCLPIQGSVNLKALSDIKVDEGRDLVEAHVVLLSVQLSLHRVHLTQKHG